MVICFSKRRENIEKIRTKIPIRITLVNLEVALIEDDMLLREHVCVFFLNRAINFAMA